MPPEDIERRCVTRRDQFEHPHFGCAAPSCRLRKFFEQFQHRRAELRQRADVLVQQIDPMLRRRLTIGLPGQAGGFEVFMPDPDARWLPFGNPFRRLLGHVGVRLEQGQLRDDILARAETIEQMSEHELGVRCRIEPQFDGLTALAKIERAHPFGMKLSKPVLWKMIQRARTPHRLQLGVRR